MIASKMTRLKKVEWCLCDGEKINNELRIRQRTDRTFQPQSIMPPDATSDILSRELHYFSQRDNLKEFSLDASVDSSILWPESQDPGSESSTWPNLLWFHIELNGVLPSGEWIQMPDPEAEEEEFNGNWDWDDDPHSEIPGDEYEKWADCVHNPIHFERFALATARAASRMPKIRGLYVTYHDMAEMGIGFVTSFLEESCCLEFTRQPPREPSEEVLDAWRKAVDFHGMEWNVHIACWGDAYYFYDL
ncbi:hypothetical protein CEP52_013107 [Fusarium oligoseptatum]|uniref:Uncharacterized protein n=3 Tax=Fusarium solani species complex TaxID=232080 RepID=A0A428SV97_9HYPO|nr:hypothetical protein CEP51_003532 [Fusarium floridanum]RSL93697.1 hypothetical protein CEP52_013107 [Fusarium oligoseptatum]RSM18083.1 hypothetical protein CDV31_003005 [Fusarium ambrosium]